MDLLLQEVWEQTRRRHVVGGCWLKTSQFLRISIESRQENFSVEFDVLYRIVDSYSRSIKWN